MRRSRHGSSRYAAATEPGPFHDRSYAGAIPGKGRHSFRGFLERRHIVPEQLQYLAGRLDQIGPRTEDRLGAGLPQHFVILGWNDSADDHLDVGMAHVAQMADELRN